jgi:serine/threonine protein kinase
LGHGKLPRSTFYYVDMELCQLDLDQYIRNLWPPSVIGRSRYFMHAETDMKLIWMTMSDIASGLSFIHSLDEVHRDLKPQNGLFNSLPEC